MTVQNEFENKNKEEEQLLDEFRNALMAFEKSNCEVTAATFSNGNWFIQLRANETTYAIDRDLEDEVIDCRLASSEWDYSTYYGSVSEATSCLLEDIR
jgi:hypothetical protein